MCPEHKEDQTVGHKIYRFEKELTGSKLPYQALSRFHRHCELDSEVPTFHILCDMCSLLKTG